jgi:hypothetical protein
MNRRQFLKALASRTALATTAAGFVRFAIPASAQQTQRQWIQDAQAQSWQATWEKSILGELGNRYCDKEMGEEIGWLTSHLLNGLYYGYQATGESRWLEIFMDWTDSWLRRGVQEPDGFVGWPKLGAAGTDVDHLNSYYADSLLGEAMALRPVVLMAAQILKDSALAPKYGAKATAYIELSERTFQKWNQRGAWRETGDGAGIWVDLPFGIDQAAGKWTDDYDKRNQPGIGFSLPNNKANHVARWHLAMHEVTGKTIYKDRAQMWFRLLKSRLRTREDDKYWVWNYWQPAGPWDYKPDGSTKHWVGVHPNGGYYEIDVQGIVAAREHGLVFTQKDVDRLIATNRDFMWNQKIEGAKFQRIDGGETDQRWKDGAGVLWSALLAYDQTLRNVFLKNHNPADWGAISTTPWFLSLAKRT